MAALRSSLADACKCDEAKPSGVAACRRGRPRSLLYFGLATVRDVDMCICAKRVLSVSGVGHSVLFFGASGAPRFVSSRRTQREGGSSVAGSGLGSGRDSCFLGILRRRVGTEERRRMYSPASGWSTSPFSLKYRRGLTRQRTRSTTRGSRGAPHTRYRACAHTSLPACRDRITT